MCFENACLDIPYSFAIAVRSLPFRSPCNTCNCRIVKPRNASISSSAIFSAVSSSADTVSALGVLSVAEYSRSIYAAKKPPGAGIPSSVTKHIPLLLFSAAPLHFAQASRAAFAVASSTLSPRLMRSAIFATSHLWQCPAKCAFTVCVASGVFVFAFSMWSAQKGNHTKKRRARRQGVSRSPSNQHWSDYQTPKEEDCNSRRARLKSANVRASLSRPLPLAAASPRSPPLPCRRVSCPISAATIHRPSARCRFLQAFQLVRGMPSGFPSPLPRTYPRQPPPRMCRKQRPRPFRRGQVSKRLRDLAQGSPLPLRLCACQPSAPSALDGSTVASRKAVRCQVLGVRHVRSLIAKCASRASSTLGGLPLSPPRPSAPLRCSSCLAASCRQVAFSSSPISRRSSGLLCSTLPLQPPFDFAA